MSTSTNLEQGPSSSPRRLEEQAQADLRREIEEEEDLENELDMAFGGDEDEEEEVADAGIGKDGVEDMEVAEQQLENEDSTKKTRSRRATTELGEPPERPKRRRTIDEQSQEVREEEEEEESQEVPAEEPVAGPSSGARQPSTSAARASEERDIGVGPRKEEVFGAAAMRGREGEFYNRGYEDEDEDEGTDQRTPGKFIPESEARRNYLSPGLQELFEVPLFVGDSDLGWRGADANRNYQGNLSRQGLSSRDDNDARGRGSDSPPSDNKQMMLARKMLFLTTDLIFPGFSSAVTGKDEKHRRQYLAVRVRSSWLLQALLYAEALFFVMWVAAFVSTADISLSVLKELHGNLVLCMSALFALVNIPRLLFGLKGNERDKLELLALFWMTTFVVQAPLFGFILFTDVFTPVRLAFTIAMDSCMMIFILLEFIIGTVHMKNLVRDELRVIKLAKIINEPPQVEEPQERPFFGSRQFPVQHVPPVPERQRDGMDEIERDDEDDWSTDEDDGVVRDEDEALRYRMRVERLTSGEREGEGTDEDDDNDDSNLVTSTSDTVRQRPVRVI